MAANRIAGLDGLRGVSILLVLAGHFGGLPALASLGVSVFFAISGYLITRLLLNEGARPNVRRFYLRRARRLLPALGGLILVLLIADGWSADGIKDAVSALGFWSNYHGVEIGGSYTLPINVLWSLALEVHFYLLLPLVITLARGDARRILTVALLVCAAVLAYRAAMVALRPDLIPTLYFYARTEFRIDALLWGVAAACLAQLGLRRVPLWPLIPMAALVLVPVEYSQAALRPSALAAALALGLFAFVHDARFGRLAEAVTPAVPLGVISYSLYLWHLPAQRLAEGAGLGVLWGVLFGLTIAVASYCLFERPIRLDVRSTRLRPPARFPPSSSAIGIGEEKILIGRRFD